jgi:hypothetical protein
MSISCGRVPAATQQRVSSDGGYPPVAADGVQFAITLGHASISIVYGRMADQPPTIAPSTSKALSYWAKGQNGEISGYPESSLRIGESETIASPGILSNIVRYKANG